ITCRARPRPFIEKASSQSSDIGSELVCGKTIACDSPRRKLSLGWAAVGRIAYGVALLLLRPNRGFRSLKADPSMSAITKWLGDGCAAATEGKRGLPSQIVLIAIRVDEFDGSFGRFYAIRAILFDGNFYFCHFCFVISYYSLRASLLGL